MSDMPVVDEGASPDELLWQPLLFRVYQRSPEERRPVSPVQGGGVAHLTQQEGEVQDYGAQGGRRVAERVDGRNEGRKWGQRHNRSP